MTVQELINRLSKFPPDRAVMIQDGFNGGGTPRDINLGPQPSEITVADEDETVDCEGRFEEEIVVIGFGCY